MTGTRLPPAADAGPPLPRAIGWAGVVLLAVCGVLSGWLEALFVPFYLGSVVFPFTLVAVVVGNVLLPRMAARLVTSTLAAALPFLGWLLVILGLVFVGSPGGDVILPGGGQLGPVVVSYTLMLLGTVVGAMAVVTAVPPQPRVGPPRVPSLRR